MSGISVNDSLVTSKLQLASTSDDLTQAVVSHSAFLESGKKVQNTSGQDLGM